jgi:hypothetical protein
MALISEISGLISRGKDPAKVPEAARQERIELYGHGLISRIKEIGLTYRFIKDYASRFPQAADSMGYTDHDKIHFYSDSFWAFGRSAFDILGQLINQTHNLGINESKCDFESVLNAMNTNHSSDPLTAPLNAIKSSADYTELNAYRNCSMHRRQVYLEGNKIERDYATAGYSGATGPVTSYDWILVDDPLVVLPTTALQRKLIAYCGSTLSFIQTNVETIIKALLA